MPLFDFRFVAPLAATLSGAFVLASPQAAFAATSLETIYTFAGGVTGSFPDAPLAVDASETYYGTTLAGGVAGEGGCGSVFKLAAQAGKVQRVETILHRFDCADGREPDAPLLLASDGALYGTTYFGGTNDLGVVFKLTPPGAGKTVWVETVLYNFTGRDGENPVGRLVQDKTGAIYGVTENGGSGLLGSIFKLTPPAAGHSKWTETTIQSLSYQTGNTPLGGLLMDAKGVLYGTTTSSGPDSLGSGVVFSLTPPAKSGAAWKYTVLHTFGLDQKDGNSPQCDLIMDKSGALYGTTTGGGPATAQGGNAGTVFKLSPPVSAKAGWTETQLYSFSGGTDGDTPFAALYLDKSGAVYGSTATGGTNHYGNIFKLTPPAKGKKAWVFSTAHDFNYDDGDYPAAGLTQTPNGVLVGTTSDGGNGFGTVFKLVP
jgi:uncharacterized repeat protein (TIGR03803 family)